MTPSTSTERATRALVDVTGVEPARGKATATTPSTTMAEMTARSASERPHGGEITSITRAATKPTGRVDPEGGNGGGRCGRGHEPGSVHAHRSKEIATLTGADWMALTVAVEPCTFMPSWATGAHPGGAVTCTVRTESVHSDCGSA